MLFLEQNRLLFKKKNINFFTTYNDGKFKSLRRKHNQKHKKSFQTKKELNYTIIKDIKSLLRLEKETKAMKDRILKDVKRTKKIIINQ